MSPKVLVSASEAKVVAHRMAGFAIVLHNLVGTIEEMEIPKHKSSWKFVPEKIKTKSSNDVFMSKERCHRLLCLKVAGRVAEEIAFGKDGINDISAKEVEAAAKFARKMVLEFGMSEKFGNRAIIIPIENQPDPSTWTPVGNSMVNKDIVTIMDRAFDKAREIIETHKDMFEKLAQTLIERRKLGQDEIKAILDGQELPKLISEDETNKNGKSKSTILAHFAKMKSFVSKL